MLYKIDVSSLKQPLILALKSINARMKAQGESIKQLPWKKYRQHAYLILKRMGAYTALISNHIVTIVKGAGKTIAVSIKQWLKRRQISAASPPPVQDDSAGSENRIDLPVVESVISQQVEGLLKDRLPGLMRSLNQACQVVESDFFDIGNELQFLHTETGRLARTATEAVQEGGGDGSGVKLSEIVERARNLLTILDEDHVIIASNLECIGSIVQRLRRLLDYSIVIKKLGKTLRMIGLNISIESARNLEAHDIFNDLAMQIRELSQVVSVAAADIQQDTETSQHNLADLHQNMDTSFNHLKSVSVTAQKAMAQAVPEVEKVVGLSTEVLWRTGEQSQQVSQQVGQIVMDIQLHDNVSQRIEHVGLALIEAHVTLLSTCRAGDDAKTEPELVCAFFILKLQAAQIGRVIEEIKEIFHTTANAFDEIKGVIRSLLESLQILDSGSRHLSEAVRVEDNPIENLKSIFLKLNELIKQGEREMDRADKATNDSKGTAECLAQHAQKIRDFNFDIHLKALNAIASSLRLGSKGRTIEVLVQDMKDLAIKSNEFVVQIEEVIEAVVSESEGLRTRVGDDVAEEAGDGPDMTQLLDTFSMICSRFESGVSMALDLGTSLNLRIDETHSKLLFLKKFADEIAIHHEGLERLIDDLKPFVNEDLMNPEEIHEQLSKRYTTQQERDIHDRMLNRSSTYTQTDHATDETECELFGDDGGECVEGKDVDSADAEDIGENVELF